MPHTNSKEHVAVLAEMLSEERRMLTTLPVKATSALIWRRNQGERRIAALEAAIEVLQRKTPFAIQMCRRCRNETGQE